MATPEDGPAVEWATLKLKLVGCPHIEPDLVTLPTTTSLLELRRRLEETHGPFKRLVLSVGRAVLLDTTTKERGPSGASRTLGDCGLWGRRYRSEAEAGADPQPIVHFIQCTFTPGPLSEPLLGYEGGP